jgi:hypothetical protein
VKRALVAGRRSLLILGVSVALGAPTAQAGSYSATGVCGNWTQHPDGGGTVITYGDCSSLFVRNAVGPFSTVAATISSWQFIPPTGTVIGRVSMVGGLTGKKGWTALVMAANGLALERCPGPACPGGSKLYSLSTSPLLSDELDVVVWCLTIPSCTNNAGVTGFAGASQIAVEIVDSSAPAVAITGGSLLTGWRRGGGGVALRATDNVGIKLDRLLVDGVPREQRARACSWGRRLPCPNGAASLSLDTTRVADGPHTLTLQAVDSANNVAGQSAVVRVDNTAPTAPLALTLAGGSAWRATDDFRVSWVNPTQQYAPIAAARYQLCPLANRPGDARGCVERSAATPDVHELTEVQPPGPGAWRLRLWLVDAAGNENRPAAAETVLRFDNSAPTVAFERPAPTDPARVRVAARDAVSPLTTVAIEARRRGDDAWIALPTEKRPSDYAAFVDDERLQRGTYDLRARAVDAAGNERTGTTGVDGRPALLKLPVRRPASLTAGIKTRLCLHRSGCHDRFESAPLLDFGRSTKLSGRLRVGGRPAAAPIEVWQRLQISGARWARVATVNSSKRGEFRYVVGSGPGSRFRFRFAGTPTARGATAFVNARVRASTTIGVNHRNAVNGEYVTFRGRLRGGNIPTGGKLIELQVFTRRLWRTFAVPRADARTGRWSFMYRFETISGVARFRFRARIEREAGYPFHAGNSRQIAVTVHGI